MQFQRMIFRLRASIRHTALFVSLIGSFLAVGTGIILLIAHANEQPLIETGTAKLSSQTSDDATDLGQGATQKLVVNAQLQVNGGFYLAPTVLPKTTKAGTLYFDQATATLQYYNGQKYVPLSGATNVTAAVTTQGGVSSLQGQSGAVSLTPGTGILINGTTISSNGLLGINGVAGDVNVTTANGIASISLSQSIAPSASPSFNGLNLSGSLVLTSAGAVRTNLIQPVGAGQDIGLDAASGNVTFTSGGRVFQFPATAGSPQTICTMTSGCPGGGGGSFVEFAPVTAQTDASGGVSVFINDTGGGNLIQLQSGGTDRFTVANNGDTTVGGALNISTLKRTLSGSTTTLGFTAPIANTTINFPALAAGTYDVCTSGGNCAAAVAVNSLNGLNGALTVANAGVSGSTITINNAAADGSTKGIAAFNGTNFSAASGVVNTIQGIATSSSPTFAGLTLSTALSVANGGTGATGASGARTNLGAAASGSNADITSTTVLNTITPSAALTVGASGFAITLQGSNASTFKATSGSFTTTLGFATPTANATINLPALSAGTYTICTTSGNCLGGGSGGANTSLSNLASVAINTALLPGSTTIDVGSVAAPFRDLYIGGAATNNFKLTGTATAGRTITFPDATGTVCLTSGNCVGSGVGAAAPNSSQYLTLASDSSLSSERVLTAGSNIGFTDAGANNSLTIAVSATPSFTSLTLTNQLTVPNGGTGAVSFTSNGIVYGNSTGALQVTAAGTTGQCLIGNTGAAPSWTACNGSGATTVGALDGGTYSANGASISGANLFLQAATASHVGLVTTGTQTFGGDKTFAGALVVSTNGAASSPAAYLSGSWFTGGSGTTTKPQLLVQPSATASTNWSTNGTGIGVNAVSGFTGNLTDLQVASSTKFRVTATGDVFAGGTIFPNGVSDCNGGCLQNNHLSFFGDSTIGVSSGKLTVQTDLYIGAADSTGTLLVLDTKTTSGDPTGADGAMYYNSSLAKFRCYQNGSWADCSGSGVTTLGTINGQTKSANGAVISGTSLYLQTADGSNPGLVSTGTQTFAGDKTFTGTTTFSGTAPDIAQGAGLVVSTNLTSTTNLQEGIKSLATAAPASASTQTYYGITGGAVSSSNNLSGGSLQGLSGGAVYSGTGTLFAAVGGGYTLFNTSSGTISYAKGIEVYNAINTGTISNLTGINVYNQTTGINNTNLLLGSTVTPGGNYSIYNDSIYNNYFAGALNVNAQLSVGTSDTTGTLLVLDTKTTSGDPTGVAGGMYYNSNLGKFRCYENGAWKDCDTTGGGGSGVTTVGALDGGTANANGATISGTTLYLQSADEDYAGLVSTVDQTFAGNKTFNDTLSSSKYLLGQDLSIIPVVGGQSAISSWWGLQLVGNMQNSIDYTVNNIGGAGDFGVVIPNQQADAVALGVLSASGQTADILAVASNVGENYLKVDADGDIILGASDSTGKLLVLDTKNTAGDPTGTDGAMYYNSNSGKFRCYQNGAWTNCIGSGGGAGSLQDAYDNSSDPATILTSSNTKSVRIQAGSGNDMAGLFNVNNAAGDSVLSVDSTNGGSIKLFGNNSYELGPWQSTTSLTYGRHRPSSVVVNGYIYVMGGGYFSNHPEVSAGKINPDGSISSWNDVSSLPADNGYSTALTANGYIYLVGNNDLGGTATADVYYVKANADGTLGTWQVATSLPTIRGYTGAVIANGYIYSIGGISSGVTSAVSYYAKLNANGSVGTWNTTTSLPAARAKSTAVVANGYVYITGGHSDVAESSTTYYAKLNADGTLGSWTAASNTLPQNRDCSVGFVANGYLYNLGGRTQGVGQVSCYYGNDTGLNYTDYAARLNSDGSIGAWNALTNGLDSAGHWTYDATVAVANGYVYNLAGITYDQAVYARIGNTVQVGGNLDLVSLQGAGLSDPGSPSDGALGGSLIAGNGTFVGSLAVQGSALFSQTVGISGTLSVGGDLAVGQVDNIGTLLILDTKNTTGDPTGADGAMYYNSNAKAFRCYQSGAWRNCIGGLVAANTSVPGGNTITNTASETNFASNYTIPADDCQPGRVYRITARGVYTSDNDNNLSLRIKFGSTTLMANVGGNLLASNSGWLIEGTVTCDTTGSSGTVEAQGTLTISDTGYANGAYVDTLPNASTITVDTTISQTLQVSADWQNAEADDSITLRQLIIEAL